MEYTERILDKDILPQQAETLKLFIRYNKLKGLKAASIVIYTQYLKSFCRVVKKPFEDVTKEDLESYLLSIKDKPEKTKANFKGAIKTFFKWFYKTEDSYPGIVRWINSSVKNARIKMPGDMLTQEEVLAIANASDNLRDRAMVLVL